MDEQEMMIDDDFANWLEVPHATDGATTMAVRYAEAMATLESAEPDSLEYLEAEQALAEIDAAIEAHADLAVIVIALDKTETGRAAIADNKLLASFHKSITASHFEDLIIIDLANAESTSFS